MKDTKRVVVCLIKNGDGKYLLIRPTNYKDFGKYQDAWYPPTGHTHVGEKMRSALIRELKEELNLEIEPIRLLRKWEQDIPGEVAFWWKCKIIGGEINKSFEIAEADWFSPDEIKNLKLWPAERKYFEKYIWK